MATDTAGVGEGGVEAQLLHDQASVVNKQARWDEAIGLWEACTQRNADAANEQGEAASFNNLGNVYQQKGEWDRAIEYYEKDLEISERVGDVHGMAQPGATWATCTSKRAMMTKPPSTLPAHFSFSPSSGLHPLRNKRLVY